MRPRYFAHHDTRVCGTLLPAPARSGVQLSRRCRLRVDRMKGSPHSRQHQRRFQADVVQPLLEAAERQIASARPDGFTIDWLRPSVGQRLVDVRYSIGAAAQALDEARVRGAVENFVATHMQAFAEFGVVLERRRCPVCGSPGRCGHDEVPVGGAIEALYPAMPERLRRPQD